MEVHKAMVLDGYRRQLLAVLPWADPLLAALHRDTFVLTHVRSYNSHVWFVRVAPPKRMQEGMGLAPELLIVLVRSAVQANTIRAAAAEVVSSGLRLDGNLMVVANGTTEVAQQLANIGGHGQRIAWMPRDGAWPSLETLLRDELPCFDAYEERDPVRGAQLIGRQAEVAELRTRIVRGDAVGLFGLRKMGKTSVMRAVTDWFDPASGTRYAVDTQATADQIAVVIDAGVVIERTIDALADEMLDALDQRMRMAGQPAAADGRRGLARWKAVVQDLLAGGNRLCIAIDEYDLLFEGEETKAPIPQLNLFFRLIRGWAQMYQGQVSLVLVGRDATFLSTPELDGVTNALLAWCTPMWIGPLSQHRANELLRKLGRRVGLDVGEVSARLAFEWTGGHPLLHRQFGSTLRSLVRKTSNNWNAPTDPVAHTSTARYCARDAVLEVLREIVALLSKRYPTALDLLRSLAGGRQWDESIASRISTEGEAARVLLNFGLVTAGAGPAATVRWYLDQLLFPEVARAG